MFKILKFVYNIIFIGILGFILTYLIIEPDKIKEILDIITANFDSKLYQIIVAVVISIYFVLIILAYIEGVVKKKKNIKIKGRNGNIEVNYATIEEIVLTYLESEPIIKKAKVVITSSFSNFSVNADIEAYKTESLNEKLDEIKQKLNGHILAMVGVTPKKINLKVVKIEGEVVLENPLKIEIIGEETNGK